MPELSIWSRERNTAMKVFSQLYVGLQTHREGVPLGFATPYEENSAGRKRQETVNNWASAHGEWKNGKYVREPAVTKIIENVPAAGFKITDDVKRVYWGGGNVVWRVEDPRGFELEIQSNNLMAIIQSAGVNEGGLIPGQCVWGRSGGDNILLHETSDEYKDAIKAAETLKAPKQVGKASRRHGGLYRCVDGSLGIYLGKLHVTRLEWSKANSEDVRQPTPFTEIGNYRVVVSESKFDLTPSVEFEGVLEVEQGKDDRPVAGKNLKLYKKAPLVDDIGDVDVEVTDKFLLTLYWAFASSAISCTRILSVTVNPILNPAPALVPWSKKMFTDRLDQIKRFVNQNCNASRGQWVHRLPLSSLLDAWHYDKVMMIDGVPYSAITTIGESSWTSNTKQTAKSFDIALPAVLGPGFIHWRSGTDDSRRALVPEAWSGYYYQQRQGRMSDQVPHLRMPDFETADGLYTYIETLYNEGKLLYVTCKEAHA